MPSCRTPRSPAPAGPAGRTESRSAPSRSSATRCSSRSSSAETRTGPAESWRRESSWGTASTTSATAVGATSAGAGWTSDQASKRATQPRSTALSSRSQARSRQPGRAVSPCSSTRPASLARSQPERTWSGVSSSAAAARSRAAVGERRCARSPAPTARPAGDAYGVGQDRPCLAGEFRGRRSALGRPGCRPGTPGRHGPSGGGQRLRADKTESGVARQLLIRLSGRHREQSSR